MGAPEMELSIDAGEHDGWQVVTVTGEIDLYTAPTLRDALGSAVDGGADRVAVDLRPVGFMDSMGLGVLISLLTRGVALVLRSVPRHAAEVLELTGVDAMLTIEP